MEHDKWPAVSADFFVHAGEVAGRVARLSNEDDNEDVSDESSSERRYALGVYRGGLVVDQRRAEAKARAVAEPPTGSTSPGWAERGC